MTRTAAPLLSLALLAGCMTPETAPTMMYRHSGLRQRPMQSTAQQQRRQTQEPPRVANGAPSMQVRPATPYAPTNPPANLATLPNPVPPIEPPDHRTVAHKELVDEPALRHPVSARRDRPAMLPDHLLDEEQEIAPEPRSQRNEGSAQPPGLERLPQFPSTQHERATMPSARLVNSKRIRLSYEIGEGDDPVVSLVDVWYTQGRGRWQRYGTAQRGQTPYVVEVPGEGTYGFLMLARTQGAVGTPPQSDDQPQMSVEVDVTKPDVSILGAKPETEGRFRSVALKWSVWDKNLKEGTVSVSYARDATGPWQPVVSGLDVDGQYVWKLPASAPYQIYLLVEAEDWAGNVGGTVTPKPLVFETPRPPVTIKAIEAAGQPARMKPTLQLQPEN